RKATAPGPFSRAVLTVIRPPVSVYLMALPSRLATTRWSCGSSATSGGSGAVSSASPMPLRRAVELYFLLEWASLAGKSEGPPAGLLRAGPLREGARKLDINARVVSPVLL